MSELIEQIKEARQQEIKDGKHAITYPPIYVVYDVIESVCEASTDYSQSTSYFQDTEERIVKREEPDDWESELIPAEWHDEGAMKVSTHDRFITVCFTRKAAEDFIAAERHNLHTPRIFVHAAERRNLQLRELCKLLGDNT